MRPSLLSAALILASGAAVAHTAWLEPDPASPSAYVVRFGGHEGRTESYPPEKLKLVQARDAQGAALPVSTAAGPEGVRVTVRGTPALLTLHYDNGIFSRAEGGRSVNKPMNENPGATQGTQALKYGKYIAQWGPPVTQPTGQPFEVVALSPEPPRAGRPWKVRVLVDGKPAAGIAVARGELTPDAVRTDDEGVASFVPQAGLNKLWAGQRTAVAGDPRFTQLSIEYLLAFEAR